MRSSLYPQLAFAARILMVMALGWSLISGDAVGVLSMILFLVLSSAYLLRKDRLSNVFDLLVALAALLNAFGFVFNLYRQVVLCDEVVAFGLAG